MIRQNKLFMQKLIFSLICVVLLMNFTIPVYSRASDDVGSSLFKPVKGLVCAIADTCVTLIEACFIGGFTGVVTGEGNATGLPSGYTDHGDRWGTYLWLWKDKIEWPTILISPEEIFRGEIPALSINFMEEKSDDVATEAAEIRNELTELINNSSGETAEKLKEQRDNLSDEELTLSNNYLQRGIKNLRGTIAKWYMTLRNIAIVGLLCVLVYVGIRMMLCSVASEKAKYKQMLMDWVVALCLIFFLHYIMSLTITITEEITRLLNGSRTVGIGLMEGDEITLEGQTTAKTTVSNLMEYARLYVSLKDVLQSCAYLIIYVWLVVYTVKFIIVYVKRFIHMAFLTMIAPLVALTYPLDKLSDGKAQAFNMWLKDYVFNALIQPFHLIIYTIFVSSALEFATNNLIYACVAIGFITPAEKFLRKMFGFDRAPHPPDTNGSFAGGAIAASAFNKIRSGIGKGNGDKEDSIGKPARTKPNYEGATNEAQMLNGSNGGSNENGQGSQTRELPNRDQSNENGQEGQQGQNGNESDNNWADSYSQGEFDDYGYRDRLETANENNEDNDNNEGENDNNTDNTLDASQSSQTNSQLSNSSQAPARIQRSRPNDSDKRKISGVKKFGKGLGNVAKKRWKSVARKGLAATGAIAGMTAGAIGAGIRGESMLKGAAMGGATGAVLGHKALDATIGAGKSIAQGGRNLAYDWRSGYDKEYADQIAEKNAFKKDKRQREFIKQNFTGSDGGEIKGKELKARMEQSYAMYQAGITDEKTRKKVMDLEDKINDEILDRLDENDKEKPEEIERSREIARQQALITNELAGQYSASTLLKDQEKIRKSIANNIQQTAEKQGVSLSDEQVANSTDVAIERLANYHGVGLEKPRNNTAPNNTSANSKKK